MSVPRPPLEDRCPGAEDMELPPEAWVACEQPERPYDEQMCSFPISCGPCQIATDAAIKDRH